MASSSAQRKRYKGIICPQLLKSYSYLRQPETEEQMYELTWSDYHDMKHALDGKPIRVAHNEYGVGQIMRNWATEDGQWWVEFELDEGDPSADFMKRQVDSGTLNALSLKHHHIDKDPYEVSLVFEPGRDGSTILLDAPEKTSEYKDASTAFRAVGATRDVVIKAAKGAMQNVVFRDGPSEKAKQADLHIISAAGGSSGLAALEHAEQIIAREQQQAAEASKKFDETRKALDLAKQRETRAQQHQKMETDGQNPAPTQAPAQGYALPPRIPSAGEQMKLQVDGQVNHAAQGGGGTLAMEEEDPTHSLPAGQQMQKQVDRQIPQPQPGTVAAAGGTFAEFLAHKKAAAEAKPAPEAQTPSTPKHRTGDPDVDAILDNPHVDEATKGRLISSMERKQAEKDKLANELKLHSAKTDEANSKWRQTWADTTLAFQQMMLRKWDPEAAKKLQEDALSGKMDDQINTKQAQNEVAAMKQAMKMVRSTQTVAKNMSAELEARAAALGRSLGTDVPAGVAHSFSSSGATPSRALVAAGRGTTPFVVPNPSEEDEEEEDEGMGLGMPKQFKKPEGPNPVVAAGKGGVRPGTGFGHASGNGGDMFAPWNVRLEASYRRGAISETSARKLLVPEKLPSNHPVVISAGKGGLGAMPKVSYTDQKGYDMSWTPGLSGEYFHPDALALVLGDGSDVPHDFELYPEDPEGGDGTDKGGAFPGQRSSRKRVKPSSVSFGA